MKKKDLQLAASRGVPALIGGQKFAQMGFLLCHKCLLLVLVGRKNKNASRTKVREATYRGSTLFYHSRKAVDAGRTEGFHIPHAHGRTSQFLL